MNRQLKDYYDKTPRFIHNMRGLASYVHFDKLYQAYLNALIYLSRLPNKESKVDGQTLLDPGHPYSNPPLNKNQSAFGTFGAPHILSLVTEVASRALKCAWYQKWFGTSSSTTRSIRGTYTRTQGWASQLSYKP